MSGFINEFKKFINKGDILQLAIGVAVGTAFNKIVTSLVNDILMPPIGQLLGGVDFSHLYINLSGESYPTLEAARKAGAATINYGVFINEIIHFIIIALSLFLIYKVFSRLNAKDKKEEIKPAASKPCPYCISSIPVEATRCPACTSHIIDIPTKG